MSDATLLNQVLALDSLMKPTKPSFSESTSLLEHIERLKVAAWNAAVLEAKKHVVQQGKEE